MDKNTLITQIKAAFKDVPQPNDNAIVLMRASATGEQASIAESLQGKSWEHFDEEEIRWHHASIGVLTPEAFAYYLPAFLIAGLDPDQSDMTFSATLWALSPPPLGTGTLEVFTERIQLLNEGQCKVVAAFFDYISVMLPEYIPLNDFDQEDGYGTLTQFWPEWIRRFDHATRGSD